MQTTTTPTAEQPREEMRALADSRPKDEKGRALRQLARLYLQVDRLGTDHLNACGEVA